jgi:hypothetical protein
MQPVFLQVLIFPFPVEILISLHSVITFGDLEMAAPNDLIKAAFENAIRDFKATLGDENLLEDISKTKSIEDVYDATDALQKEQAEKGRLRHLAKIQPYLEGLRSYASVIEVFVQSKQDVLSLIWGPIKLLLHWTNNMKQSFDAIVDAIADIGLLLPEFQAVRTLFSHNEHIKDVLVFFFRDILDFYLIVLKFFRKTCKFILGLRHAARKLMYGFLRLGIDFRIHVDEATRKDQYCEGSNSATYNALETRGRLRAYSGGAKCSAASSGAL